MPRKPQVTQHLDTLHSSLDVARKSADALVEMMPGLSRDELDDNKVISEIREAVHKLTGDNGLDLRVRTAGRLAIRKAKRTGHRP